MNKDFTYLPVFRIRQQEKLVLESFQFGNHIVPLLEIIKEKDRVNNKKSSVTLYSELIESIKAKKVFLDLPISFNPTISTSEEVIKFYRKFVDNIENRIKFLNQFSKLAKKVVPVISSYLLKTGEEDTIRKQYNELKSNFQTIAFRLFTTKFSETFSEIKGVINKSDYIIYDLESIPVTSPAVKKNIAEIRNNYPDNFKIAIRSAINSDIQNSKLENGEVIGEADNSLIDFYEKEYKFDSWGDYAGIKKDEISAGGTISPGFIFFNPVDNDYYGYKGKRKDLSEFENTIIPEVLKSDVLKLIRETNPKYLTSRNICPENLF
jgi:hypothetical protein